MLIQDSINASELEVLSHWYNSREIAFVQVIWDNCVVSGAHFIIEIGWWSLNDEFNLLNSFTFNELNNKPRFELLHSF